MSAVEDLDELRLLPTGYETEAGHFKTNELEKGLSLLKIFPKAKHRNGTQIEHRRPAP